MSEVFAAADDLGPARVIHVQEVSLDLKAVLMLDNVAHGQAIGGLRIAPDLSVEEYLNLQRRLAHLFAPARNQTLLGEIQAGGDRYWDTAV